MLLKITAKFNFESFLIGNISIEIIEKNLLLYNSLYIKGTSENIKNFNKNGLARYMYLNITFFFKFFVCVYDKNND